jgi:hypothetical protein
MSCFGMRMHNIRPFAVALVASLALGAVGGGAANGHGQATAPAPALEADTRSYIGT